MQRAAPPPPPKTSPIRASGGVSPLPTGRSSPSTSSRGGEKLYVPLHRQQRSHAVAENLEGRFSVPDVVVHQPVPLVPLTRASAVGSVGEHSLFLRQPVQIESAAPSRAGQAERTRRARDLPDHAALPNLQPSGPRSSTTRVSAATTTAEPSYDAHQHRHVPAPESGQLSSVPLPSAELLPHRTQPQQEPEPHVAVAPAASRSPPQTWSGRPKESSDGQRWRVDVGNALAADSTNLSIGVIVKGISTVAGRAAPPPRSVEITPSPRATVYEVVDQCLVLISGVGSSTSGDHFMPVVDGLTVQHAHLVQRGRELPQTSLLDEVSQRDVLYFLFLTYGEFVGERPSRASPPASGAQSEQRGRTPVQVDTLLHTNAQDRIFLLERRLAAVENFVKERSEERPDSVPGRAFKPPSASLYALPEEALSPIPVAQRGDSTQASILRDSATAVAGFTNDHSTTASEATQESYAVKAEKLAYLALPSRKERLAKLDELKRFLDQKTELYRWMTNHVDGSGAVPSPLPGAPSGVAVGVGMSGLHNPSAVSGASSTAPQALPIDAAAHVEYDPVLDIWRLRRTPQAA